MALFGEEPPEPAGNTVLRGLYLGVARLRAWFSESEEEYGFVDDDDLRVRLAAALVIDAQNGWAPEHRVDQCGGRARQLVEQQVVRGAKQLGARGGHVLRL